MSSIIPNDIILEQVRTLLRLPHAGQIGYVVEDVYSAVDNWQTVYQRTPWIILDHDHPCIFHGKQGRCNLRIALAYDGPIQIELIEVLEGETIHVGAASKPEGQIHHLGFMVRNLDQKLNHCERNGARVIQKGTIKSAGFKINYAYLDVSAIGGTDLILELIQWSFGYLPIPVNRLIFNISRFLGSWTVFRGKIIK